MAVHPSSVWETMINKDDIVKELLAIPDVMDATRARKIRNSPVQSNRAGDLGHPCVRQLTYARTSWQLREPYDVGLQYLFDERRRQEKLAIQDLEEAGYTFIEEQTAYTWPKYQISGYIDGKLILPRGATSPHDAYAAPAEIKNINQWAWD